MDRNEYCERVLAQAGRLTGDEASELRDELSGHIEDHAEALIEHGYTEEDAAARAVALMGDPEETGKALRDQYGGWWLVVVRRIAVFITVVVCVQSVFTLPLLTGVYESVRERLRPTVSSVSWDKLDGAADLHERIPIGDDIVQLNRIEYGVREGERQAVLWVSAYDSLPGRKVYEPSDRDDVAAKRTLRDNVRGRRQLVFQLPEQRRQPVCALRAAYSPA